MVEESTNTEIMIPDIARHKICDFPTVLYVHTPAQYDILLYKRYQILAKPPVSLPAAPRSCDWLVMQRKAKPTVCCR